MDLRLSYTVPLPKEDRSVKNNTVENYRAISISPIVSKIFEHCVLKRYNNFFDSSYNQFGFKKNSSCGHAVYSVRKVVEHYVNGGSTVNVCLLDLSKAFDKVNQFALYIELMNRSVPITLLQMLENWFSVCLSCVKWGHVLSHFYELKTGVRQGAVLSPLLFSIFMDRLASAVNKEKLGCRIGISCCAIFMYADDVILLAPTVHALQTLVNICEAELNYLDMAINVRKSACLRFGSRYKNTCANVLVAGQHIEWVNSARYLGVYFESSFRFKCTFTRNKANFYRAFNSIYGKIAHNASEEVLIELIRTKCVPVLLYGVEFCPLNSSDIIHCNLR